MSSSTHTSPKASAPSICSFDSGYASNTLDEEDGAWTSSIRSQVLLSKNTELGLGGIRIAHVGDRIKLRKVLPIEPIVTRLSVFTTKDTSDHSDFLPEIPSDEERCMECKFWSITNPSENIECYSCRHPKTIEPVSGEESKNALPKLYIPGERMSNAPSTCTPQSSMEGQPSSSRLISRCSACELVILLDSSSSGACPSCSTGLSYTPPASPPSPHFKIRRSRAGRNSKLPSSALARLQGWLDANQQNPYPSADTKKALAEECGITGKQVTTWFTNARARQLQGQPAEHDLAARGTVPESSSTRSQPYRQSRALDSTHYLSDSVYPLDAYASSSSEDGEAFSSPQPQIRPSRRGKKKDYRRNQTPAVVSPTSITSPLDTVQTDQETWQCTFCRKALVPKSWRRHEETQHRPKAQWTCMMYGPRLSIPARSDSNSVCAFCMVKNPSEDHFLHHHRIEDCAKRDVEDRTFFRPDHLRQHVKNFHNASLFDMVQARWKRAAETVVEGWTCGFCSDRLDTWDRRETHISNHFKDGMTMDMWTDYSECKNAHAKKSKGKENIFTRLATSRRTSRVTRQPNAAQDQQQQQPQPQAYQDIVFSNFDPIPTTIGLGISQPQPPVLPNLPTLDSLTMNDCSNYIDATTYQQHPSIPTMQYNTTLQSQYYGNTPISESLQYPIASTSMFDPTIESTALQQEFDCSLQTMGLYTNQINYQGPWDPHHLQQQSQRHAQQPAYQQHNTAITNTYDFTNIHDLAAPNASHQSHMHR